MYIYVLHRDAFPPQDAVFFVSLIKLATFGGAMIPWSRFGGSHPVVAQALMNQFVDIYIYIHMS